MCFFLSLFSPERILEDHESVVEVQATWPVGGDSRFVFRKNYAKYELFKSSPVSWNNLKSSNKHHFIPVVISFFSFLNNAKFQK